MIEGQRTDSTPKTDKGRWFPSEAVKRNAIYQEPLILRVDGSKMVRRVESVSPVDHTEPYNS